MHFLITQVWVSATLFQHWLLRVCLLFSYEQFSIKTTFILIRKAYAAQSLSCHPCLCHFSALKFIILLKRCDSLISHGVPQIPGNRLQHVFAECCFFLCFSLQVWTQKQPSIHLHRHRWIFGWTIPLNYVIKPHKSLTAKREEKVKHTQPRKLTWTEFNFSISCLHLSVPSPHLSSGWLLIPVRGHLLTDAVAAAEAPHSLFNCHGETPKQKNKETNRLRTGNGPTLHISHVIFV